MKKEIIRTDSVWIKVKIYPPYREYIYGFRDRTNIHGHTVLSGSEVIYQRDLSGAQLVNSGDGLFLVKKK